MKRTGSISISLLVVVAFTSVLAGVLARWYMPGDETPAPVPAKVLKAKRARSTAPVSPVQPGG
jgi:hypothetical protein